MPFIIFLGASKNLQQANEPYNIEKEKEEFSR